MIIERVIRNYLESKLACHVTFEVQKRPPEKYYILEKTGSKVSNHIYRSSFALQSYAGKMVDAMTMSAQAVEAMLAAIELDEICRVDLNSEYNFTDPTTDKYRYQAVFDVVHY